MLTDIHPKLPMRNKEVTKKWYSEMLGFKEWGENDYEGYLMMQLDNIQIHFFEYKALDPLLNYGQVYIRINNIEMFYNELLQNKVSIHPSGNLSLKPWNQLEFSLLDPDNNLLTFGQSSV